VGIQELDRLIWIQKGQLSFTHTAFSGVFTLRSTTKTKTTPTSLTFSPNSTHFATISHPSLQIRIFNFLTGKLYRAYDESMSAVQAMQQAGTAIYKLDDMEFGRRLAVERELEKDSKAGATMNVVWDESGNFLLYPSMLGIKGAICR
jgi:peptidylprolyl isomerase domain and WD repeat-containing protein 1